VKRRDCRRCVDDLDTIELAVRRTRCDQVRRADRAPRSALCRFVGEAGVVAAVSARGRGKASDETPAPPGSHTTAVCRAALGRTSSATRTGRARMICEFEAARRARGSPVTQQPDRRLGGCCRALPGTGKGATPPRAPAAWRRPGRVIPPQARRHTGAAPRSAGSARAQGRAGRRRSPAQRP